jgi:hypothetical protein
MMKHRGQYLLKVVPHSLANLAAVQPEDDDKSKSEIDPKDKTEKQDKSNAYNLLLIF